MSDKDEVVGHEIVAQATLMPVRIMRLEATFSGLYERLYLGSVLDERREIVCQHTSSSLEFLEHDLLKKIPCPEQYVWRRENWTENLVDLW